MRNRCSTTNLRRFHLFVASWFLASAITSTASAQQNLGFEQTENKKPLFWNTKGAGYDITVDDSEAYEGDRSLRIQRNQNEPLTVPFAAVSQQMKAASGTVDRLRFSAYLRTDHVADGWAGLFVQITDQSGKVLYFDSMQSTPLTGTTDWQRYRLDAPLVPNAARVLYGVVLAGSGTVWVDKVESEAIESQTLPPPTDDAAAYLRSVLDIMREHSVQRDGIDWSSFTAAAMKFARGANSPDDTYPAIRDALRRLNDRHSNLLTPMQAQQLDTENPSLAGYDAWMSPEGSLLEGHIGYISVPRYIGTNKNRMTRFADELQSTIASVDSTAPCGWVIDLRRDTGGTVSPMLAGLGPVLGNGNLGGGIDRNGIKTQFWYRDGQVGIGEEIHVRVSGSPYRLANDNPPVAVLIGPSTESSGEQTALAFVGRPVTRSFGLPTAGLVTGNDLFPLPDGALLILSTGRMIDRTGAVYQGPIEPDVRIEEEKSASIQLAEQSTVQSAVSWLKEQASCR